MVGASPPYLIVVAGPNGAGKTTFAKKNLKWFIEAHTFLNADEIAREDNPDDVSAVALEAGRKALARRTNLLKAASLFASRRDWRAVRSSVSCAKRKRPATSCASFFSSPFRPH